MNTLVANASGEANTRRSPDTTTDPPSASDAAAGHDLYTSGDYLELVPTWHVEESTGKAREILRLLDRAHLAPHSIGDVGCGAGEVLRQLQVFLPRDCELAGYDISPQAIALAHNRENQHLRFTLGDLLAEPSVHYDLLLALDVVEHLEDHFAFLRALRAHADYTIFFFPLELSVQTVIRPYGLLHTRDAYGHLHYFTRELALRALADTGYTVLDAVYTSEALELPTRLIGRNLLKPLRKLLFALHPDVAVRLLGGYRLLVLAR